MAFSGLGVGAARRLLVGDYGSWLAGVSGNPAATVARSGGVVRYLGDYRALVHGRHGLEVVTSSVPLRVADGAGGKRPVDLRLVAGGGGFAPVRPLAGVSIARDSGGGVAVGGDGLRVVPEGANVPGGLMGGGQDVFFGGVGRDMDAVAAPVLGGAELFAILRSRLSPQEIRYRVTLPSGAVLRAEGGGAVVSRGGVALARIPAPVARDAEGSPVEVSMVVSGDELVLSVPHRGYSLDYPLIVDPSIININEKSEHWKSFKTFRSCGEEAQIFGKGPGLGSPLAIEAPTTEYPRPEIPFCKEEERNYQIANFMWIWEAATYFTGIEFYNVSLATSAKPENGEASRWELDACSRDITGYNGTPPPSTVVRTEIGCTSGGKNEVYVSLFVGQLTKLTPVTVSASLSVGGILLREAWVLPEEPEVYGTGNPGEPQRKDCLLGHPVNCATGNQVESQTDLRVGGRGLGLDMTRTYNSRMASKLTTHGPFGPGWAGPYSAHLATEKVVHGELPYEVATVYHDNGSTVRFERPSGEAAWSAAGPLVQASLVSEGTAYVYTLPNQTKLKFDNKGLLTSESDRNGNVTTLSHNGEGRLESVADPAGRALTFAYNAEGLVESAKDSMGHTVKYVYEGGNLASVTLPGESKPRWKYKYDKSHQLIGQTDGDGNTTTTEYDASRRVISQTDQMKRTRKWEYTGTAGLEETKTIITEPNGSSARERFNEQVLPMQIFREGFAGPNVSINYAYDLYFNLISASGPEERTTTYTYNAAGDRTSEKNPDGNEAKWTYNGTHDVLTATTPNGETTTIKRDSHGNAEAVSRPAPGGTTQTTSYQYEPNGDLKSMTDPLKHTWSYEYDKQGDRTAETDPEGDKRTVAYDEDSRETSTVSPAGNAKGAEASQYTTKIERDSQGRPTTITDPLGHTTKYTYDANGNLETVTDGNGRTTTYTYDGDNERTKTKEPNGTTTETGYDAMGHVTSQTDGNKHTTTYLLDYLGDVIESTDPLGRLKFYQYNALRELTQAVNGEEQVVSHAYDPAGLLKETTYPDEKAPAVKYEYDADGNRVKMTDGTGTTTYTYDLLDRPVQSTNGHGDKTGWEYDLAGQQTKLTYPNGNLITRAYDKAGRLQSVTDASKNTTTFVYDPNSNLTTVVFPKGTNEQDKTTYNNADQQTKITIAGNGVKALASLTYTRDNDGQIKATTTAGALNQEKLSHAYDTNNRLEKSGSTAYAYDSADNPTTLGANTSVYDAANELKTSGTNIYGYNQIGQRVTKTPKGGQTTTYAYDDNGNLTQAKGGTLNVTYAYNGDGLRVSQTKGKTTSYTTWDTHAGLPVSLGDEKNTYIYGPGDLPIEQIQLGKGAIFYLHHDQQGSTRLLTSSTGAVEGTSTYDAYGNTTATKGTVTTPLGYDAQYTDTDTGLIYLRARAYDPATAQFLSVDPLASVTGAPYAYGGDNPLNNGDRTGLSGGPFEGEVNLPCVWPCGPPPPGAREAVEEGIHSGEQALESLYNSITGDQSATNDEGEQVLQERQAADEACSLLEQDKTRKVHRELPSYPSPNWTHEDLEQIAEDLRKSLGERREELAREGEEGGHRNRVAEEERLLRQIERLLG
jgi:RHS repeat-associated protein